MQHLGPYEHTCIHSRSHPQPTPVYTTVSTRHFTTILWYKVALKRLDEDAKMYKMKPSPVSSGNVIISESGQLHVIASKLPLSPFLLYPPSFSIPQTVKPSLSKIISTMQFFCLWWHTAFVHCQSYFILKHTHTQNSTMHTSQSHWIWTERATSNKFNIRKGVSTFYWHLFS